MRPGMWSHAWGCGWRMRLIAEVKDDGCVTPRSEVADDHGLSEVDLTRAP